MKASFLEQFKVHSKTERKNRFPLYLCSQVCIVASLINIPHQSSTFVTVDELTLTHHNHPNLQFTLSVTHSIVCSVGLNKYKMIYINYYGIIQSIFTALKIHYASLIHSPDYGQPLILLLFSLLLFSRSVMSHSL